MWKSALGAQALKLAQSILPTENLAHQQIRTTFILKRKHAPHLSKKNGSPKLLRNRHYIYELVKDTNVEKLPNMDVILTTYVEGLGNIGERVNIKPHWAYNNLILPGLAVYPSAENIEKYKNYDQNEVKQYSSSTSVMMVKTLSRITLSVTMNKDHPWTIQPWHIKACFRKCGYVVPEEAITLPKEPIQGPNISIENQEFYVTVAINNAEKVNVRCRLHHWATDITDRLPYKPEFWNEESQPIYQEHSDILKKIPPKGSYVDVKDLC